MRKSSRGLCFLAAAAGMAVALTLAGSPAYADPDKGAPSTALPAEPVPGGFRSWPELIDTQERLRVAAERLTDQQAAIAQEDGVTAVEPQADGGGLTVRYRGSEEEARALPAIRAASVPVTIEPFDTTQPVSCTGRQDDCSPYWGGAKYVMPGGGWCSMGFSLKFSSYLLPYSSSTWTRMLSAGHCSSDGTAIVDGGGDSFGTIAGDYDTQDILTISPAAGVSLGGRVYVGPWNSGA